MKMHETGNHKLMAESYTLLAKSLSGRGKLPINKALNSKVHRLNQDHGLKQEEVLQGLFVAYVEKESFKKYDSEKAKLSTFITHVTYNEVRNLKRGLDRFKRNYPVIPFEEWPKQSVGSSDSSKKRPYEEQLSALGAAETSTPEDYYMAKELLSLMRYHYGEDDTAVLIGLKDKKTEAERLSISQDTYRKRLARKTVRFKKALKRAGYL